MGEGEPDGGRSLDRPIRVRFGGLVLDRAAAELRGPEGPVRLPPRVYALLDLLVSRAGKLVSKDEILDQVWRDAFVEEGSVNRAISTLRRALGDDGEKARFIETVPKRGYRFVAATSASAETPLGNDLPATGQDVDPERGVAVVIRPAEVTDSGGVDHATRTSGAWRAAPAASSLRRRLPAVAVLGLLAVMATVAVQGRLHRSPATLAVLPFVVAAGSPRDTAMGVGLADRVVARVSPALPVRPLSAVLPFGSPGRDAARAGATLGVSHVLDATLQRAEDGSVEASAVLLDVDSGVPCLTFRERVDSLDAVADRIGTRVLVALGGVDPGIGVPPRYTRISEAYALYLEARQLWQSRSGHVAEQVVRLLRNALELDPNFALAHVALAEQLVLHDYRRGEFREAEALAERALQIDPTLGEAWAAIGFSKLFHRWDPQGAERDFRRAQRLSPRYATAPQWLATCLAVQGKLPEALTQLVFAGSLDPLSGPIYNDQAEVLYFMGSLGDARTSARSALAHGDSRGQNRLLQIALMARDFEEARRAAPSFAMGCATVPSSPAEIPEFGRAVASPACETNLPVFERAAWAAWAGSKPDALALLERARDEHDFFAIYAGVDPRFASLKGDPRYEAVLRAIGVRR